jgi:hypothetical protein
MQQLTIRMPEEYFLKIEQIAKSIGLKKSDVTRMAIRKFIEEYIFEEEADPYSKRQKDWADIVRLIEEYSSLAELLPESVKKRIE